MCSGTITSLAQALASFSISPSKPRRRELQVICSMMVSCFGASVR
ncbi:Uncharacterised protein [Vibrio cholerae]|nr:Uncharacterised protein [Vibrio cholerae]CSI84303.1 Uncharacterised protein [Vibrio cholerae]